MSTTIDTLLERLEAVNAAGTDAWTARCPRCHRPGEIHHSHQLGAVVCLDCYSRLTAPRSSRTPHAIAFSVGVWAQ
jgi:recombinational DNA repair protein (RecF pathway)